MLETFSIVKGKQAEYLLSWESSRALESKGRRHISSFWRLVPEPQDRAVPTPMKAILAENSILEIHLVGLSSHHHTEVIKLIFLDLGTGWFGSLARGVVPESQEPGGPSVTLQSGDLPFSTCSQTSANGGECSSALESKYFMQRTSECSGLSLSFAAPSPWLLPGSQAEATGTGLLPVLAHILSVLVMVSWRLPVSIGNYFCIPRLPSQCSLCSEPTRLRAPFPGEPPAAGC